MLTKCLLCDGKLIESNEDVTEKVLGYTFEFKNVPVLKCSKCGEIHYTAEVNQFMEDEIKKNLKRDEKIIINYQ
jgi:YgiT-type zinc finger domain-containing protein